MLTNALSRSLLAARHRLSARLDPVRPDPHPPRRARRHPRHRLRQYRRHQRAPHRPARTRRRRRSSSTRSRAPPRSCRRLRYRPRTSALFAGARRVPRPPLSGLARLQGRQGRRHLSRRARSALALAGGARRSASSGSATPPSRASPRSARWSPASSRRSLLFFLGDDRMWRSSIVALTAHPVVAARRQHPPPRSPAPNAQDRRAAMTARRGAGPAHRRPAPRLAPADPERERSARSPSAS